MTLTAALFRGCSRLAAFPGGSAPVRLCTELSRNAENPRAFARAGAWIEEFFDVVPALGQYPLCDPLLGALANALLQPVNTQPAARKNVARHSDVGSAGSSPRPSRQDLRTIAQRTAVPESPALSKPMGAGWASTRASARMGASGTSPAASFERLAMRGTTPAMGSSFHYATPTRVSSDAAVRAWQDRLTERIAARVSGPASVMTFPSPSSAYLKHQWMTPQEGPSTLANLWMTPLNGPEVSRELLTLAAGSSHGAIAGVTPGVSGFNPPDPAGGPHIPAQAGLPAAVAHIRQAVDGTLPSASGESHSSAAAQEFTQELISRANDEPWVPPLAPAERSATQVTVPAISSRLVRTEVEPAKQNFLEAGENLSGFSAMMKRVLDEEARRYGIDV